MIEIGAGLGSNLSVFDGSTNAVTVDAYVQVDDGASLELIGTIHNPGTIVLGSESGADLVISGPVTLDGTGTISLQGSGSVITGAGGSTDALTNIGNLISGSGTIESLSITNQSGGTFDFTGPSTFENVNVADGQLAVTIASDVKLTLNSVVFDNITVANAGTVLLGNTLTLWQRGLAMLHTLEAPVRCRSTERRSPGRTPARRWRTMPTRSRGPARSAMAMAI